MDKTLSDQVRGILNVLARRVSASFRLAICVYLWFDNATRGVSRLVRIGMETGMDSRCEC